MENQGPFCHLPPNDHGTVCTEVTDTVAAQMEGRSGLADFAGPATPFIVL